MSIGMVDGALFRLPTHLESSRVDSSYPSNFCSLRKSFSAAANIVDKKQVRLKPENVDLLVFLRGNKDFVDWG